MDFFVIFGVFFVPLKQFLDYLDLFLALKINSEKKKTYPTRTGRARRPDPLRPARARAGLAARPAKAHRPRLAMAVAAAAWVCEPRALALAPL
jgi:hypothetical protein